MMKDEFFNFPHHRGQFSQDLIIPESDNPQPQHGQRLFPPGIFFILLAIHSSSTNQQNLEMSIPLSGIVRLYLHDANVEYFSLHVLHQSSHT